MIGRYKLFICTRVGQKWGSKEVDEWKQIQNINKNLRLCKNEQIIFAGEAADENTGF